MILTYSRCGEMSILFHFLFSNSISSKFILLFDILHYYCVSVPSFVFFREQRTRNYYFPPACRFPECVMFLLHRIICLLSGNYSCLVARFHLSRSVGFHMVQSYIPTILIVVISWVSFWMDVDSVPGRTTLGVTTLLTVSSKSAGKFNQSEPQASKVG